MGWLDECAASSRRSYALHCTTHLREPSSPALFSTPRTTMRGPSIEWPLEKKTDLYSELIDRWQGAFRSLLLRLRRCPPAAVNNSYQTASHPKSDDRIDQAAMCPPASIASFSLMIVETLAFVRRKMLFFIGIQKTRTLPKHKLIAAVVQVDSSS